MTLRCRPDALPGTCKRPEARLRAVCDSLSARLGGPEKPVKAGGVADRAGFAVGTSRPVGRRVLDRLIGRGVAWCRGGPQFAHLCEACHDLPYHILPGGPRTRLRDRFD